MRGKLALTIIVTILCGGSLPFAAYAATAFGFGVGVPTVPPINWSESFSYITAEAFTDSSLSVLFTLGTYPTDFPLGFETNGSLLAKGWIGPVAVCAGGGLSIYWDWISASSAWSWSPAMNLIAGIQWQVAAPLSLSFQVRSLDPIPLTFTLHPQISLGASLVFGPPAPHPGLIDGRTLWVIVGLGVLVLVAYLPRT